MSKNQLHIGAGPPRGFTLVEVLIVVGIITILLALLLPTVGLMRANSRRTHCANNLRQTGLGLRSAEKQLGYPLRARNWPADLSPYLEDETAVFRCADDVFDAPRDASYGMNHRAHRMGPWDGRHIVMLDYRLTQATIVVGDIADQDDWPDTVAARHMGSVNVLFHDGGVQAMNPDAIDPTICEYFARYWRPHRDALLALSGCRPLRVNAGDAGTSGGTTLGGGSTESNETTDGTGETTDSSTSGGDGGSTGGSSDGSTDGTTGTTGGETNPTPTLCSPSASNGYVNGLCGAYYKSTQPEMAACWVGDCPIDGSPDALQIDSDLNFPEANYGLPLAAAITGGNPAQAYAVVWKGQIKADYSEAYTLHVAYDNGVRIKIGGQTVFEETGIIITSHPCCAFHAGVPFSMTADKWVDIEVFQANHWGPHHLVVQWSSASTPLAPIPTTAFRTARP